MSEEVKQPKVKKTIEERIAEAKAIIKEKKALIKKLQASLKHGSTSDRKAGNRIFKKLSAEQLKKFIEEFGK